MLKQHILVQDPNCLHVHSLSVALNQTTIKHKYCSRVGSETSWPEVEYLMTSCRPHYLPREFSSIFFVAVYVPPKTGTKTSLSQLYQEISKQETSHPEAVLLVAWDFYAGKLKSIWPHFYQHVKCATRGEKILDHLYSTHRDVYKALPRPPFDKSDHNSILLIPAYQLKLKQEAPVTQSIKESGQMKQILNYRTVLLAQTGICYGILPMALRSTPHQSLALSISALRTSYVHTPTRSHG